MSKHLLRLNGDYHGELSMKIRTKDKIEVFCKYCEHASPIVSEDKMVCPKYGVVSADYKCRRFRYDPLKRSPRRAVIETAGLDFPCIDDSEKKIKSEDI